MMPAFSRHSSINRQSLQWFAISAVLVAFAIPAAAATEKIIYSAPGTTDAAPSIWASDSAGNLYGITYFGGANNLGSIIELSPSGIQWVETTLYSFQAAPDGQEPTGLVRDSSGNLYGTTIYGGTGTNSQCIAHCGTIFELSPGSGGAWTETVLYNFTGKSDGGNPSSGLVMDSNGNLYGTTTHGGSHTWGVVFRIKPSASGWSFSRLYAFGDSTDSDGAFPLSSVAMDSAGNLYGTAPSGGLYEKGIAYQLAPASSGEWTETILYNFGVTRTDSAVPFAGLVLDSQGNLFGAASTGGRCQLVNTGCGTVYELSPGSGGSWTETILYHFAGPPDASGPDLTPIFDAAGNLYAAANGGSAFGCQLFGPCGAIIKLAFTGSRWKEAVLYSFTGSPDGNQPVGSPIFGPNGNLYGGTEYGGTGQCNSGTRGCGTVYVVKP